MNQPVISKKAPSFKAAATDGTIKTLNAFKGKNLILYFYPRDNTPGCTTEGLDFNSNLLKFKRANSVVLGISQDTLASHEKFRQKQGFKFDLLSDESGEMCRAYNVIKLKNMYGKKFEGIERSTFLIDAQGVLRAQWRKVIVAGHVEAVLVAAKALNKRSQ